MFRSYPKYKEFAELSTIEFGEETYPPVVKVDRKGKDTALLAAIFAIDPITDLPRGDLAQYMSKDTNPQIKQFIQNQLMQENTPVGSSSGLELSDDDLIRYERKAGESVRDYVDRMAGYVRDDVLNLRLKKN